jgi:hypothetical protein
MGFDGLFFGRADYEDYRTRNRTKTMEMVWKASANLGEMLNALERSRHERHDVICLDRQSWLFTGVLPNGYSPPDSFCFDFGCDDEPIMARLAFFSLRKRHALHSFCIIIFAAMRMGMLNVTVCASYSTRVSR